MKRILFLVLFFTTIASSQVVVQQVNFGNNTPFNRSEWFIPNSPTSTVGNRYVAGWIKAYEMFYMKQDSVRFKALVGVNDRLVIADSLGTLYTKSFNYFYPSSNPDNFISSFTEIDPTVSAWAKQPTKPTYVWSEIGEKPTIPSNQTLSISGSTLSISDGNSVTLPSTAIIISNPTRSFNTNFNVINTTLVFYSIKIENGTALVSATTGTAYLEYSVNGGTSWVTVSQVMREENGLSLLNINTKGSTFVLSGIIPGGSLARIRINALAGSSISLLSTQENAF